MSESRPSNSLVSIDDLSQEEITALLDLAERIELNRDEYRTVAAGMVCATLFYEPSTRTRLSFESAMLRLGGGVISAWDMDATSASKGESLADTTRVVGEYSDVIVLRHPSEGAAQLATEYSPVPVINAGDGAHEHPTQTLCDLYTLRKHHGKLEGLTVALCGDLKNGRTVHSLAFALARFKANVVFVPGSDGDVPPHVLHRLERDFGARIEQKNVGMLQALFGLPPEGGQTATVNAIYMTPTAPHQLALSPAEGEALVDFNMRAEESLSIYVTRRQREREMAPDSRSEAYPSIGKSVLDQREFKNVSILHPLPRTSELNPDADADARSLYFKQAANGIPVRMALLLHILGLERSVIAARPPPAGPSQIDIIDGGEYACGNPRCVSNHEGRFARRRFELSWNSHVTLRCTYCDHETQPTAVGNAVSKLYFAPEVVKRFGTPIRPDHLRFFPTAAEAEAAGFTQGANA